MNKRNGLHRRLAAATVLLITLSGCFRPIDPPPSEIPPVTLPPETAAETAITSAESAVSPESTAAPEITDAMRNRYFDGAVFVGDSILEGIRQYVAQARKMETTLGEAQFLATVSGVTVRDLAGGETNGFFYRYNGKNRALTEILSEIKPARVFLLLGLNDLSGQAEADVSAVVEDYGTLLDRIAKILPDAEIAVITGPPKVKSSWLPDYTLNRKFDNALIAQYADALIDLCEERGIHYVDAHKILQNEDGVLPDEWCRDGYVHLNNEGAAQVVKELYRYAEKRMEESP